MPHFPIAFFPEGKMFMRPKLDKDDIRAFIIISTLFIISLGIGLIWPIIGTVLGVMWFILMFIAMFGFII